MVFLFEIFIIVLNLLVCVFSTPFLIVTNNGPAVLDGNVTFDLMVKNLEWTTELVYIFNDNVNIQNVSSVSNNTSFSKSFIFPSSHYDNGSYNMLISVKYNDKQKLSSVVTNFSKFELSDSLIGKVIVNRPEGLNDVSKVAVGENFSVAVQLYDANNFLKSAEIDYMWSIDYDRQSFTMKNFSYLCVVPQTIVIVSNVIAILPNNIWKSGMFYKEISVLDPVAIVNVTGNPFIRHGEVLNLNVSCNGSSPYIYCVEYFTANESTQNFSCKQRLVTNICYFNISRYLPKSGTYNYIIYVENDVNHVEKNIQVMVYNVNKQPQLSTVIIPIVCSLMALIIISGGIAYFIQQRSQIAIEVANFDFQEDAEEPFTSRTFFEQLFDSFNCGCTGSNSNDTDMFDDEQSPLIGKHRSRTPSF